MNKLTLPPSPNWYLPQGFVCAPDGTLVYASRSDVVVIKKAPPEEPANISVIRGIHSKRVLSLALCPVWEYPDKQLAVTASEDHVVRLLDINNCVSKSVHILHRNKGIKKQDKIVGVTFSGNEKVVSVSEFSYVYVWYIALNKVAPVNISRSQSQKISCVLASPHNPWMIAFGLKKGGVLIIDIRDGKTLHTLSTPDGPIISLSWCPTPYNVFPFRSKNQQENKYDKKKLHPFIERMHEQSKLFRQRMRSRELVPALVDATTGEIVEEESFVDYATLYGMSPELGDNASDEDSDFEDDPSEKGPYPFTFLHNMEDCNITISDVSDVEVHPDFEDDVTEVKSNKDVDSKQEVDKAAVHPDIEDGETKAKSNEDYSSKQKQGEGTVSPGIEDDETKTKPSEDIHLKQEQDKVDFEDSKTKAESNKAGHSKQELDKVDFEDGKTKPELNKAGHSEQELDQVATSFEDTETKVKSNVNDHSRQEQDKIAVSLGVEKNISEVKQESCDSFKNTAYSSITGFYRSFESLDEENDILTSGTTSPDLNFVRDSARPPKDYLLASVARGFGSVKIWRAGTDGLLHTELFIRKDRSFRVRKEDRAWLTVCWVTPADLMCSSQKGELVHWRLTGEKRKGRLKSYRMLHHKHYRHIFGIAAPITVLDDFDWQDESTDYLNTLNVWSMGKDRQILLTNLSPEPEIVASYPTIGASVNCLVPSPINPFRLAIGTSDGFARMWDLSIPHVQRIEMPRLYYRTQVKVTSLAWHPKHESCLAFGTDKGQVGLFDTMNPAKTPNFFVHVCKMVLYKIEWAPLIENPDVIGLYIVANGRLIAYDVDKPPNEQIKYQLESIQVSTFAWKSDYSVLAIGTKVGEVLLMSKKFKLLTKFMLQTKLIRFLAWHPLGTDEEYWLASAAHDVVIYDCSEIKNNDETEWETTEQTPVAIFTNHINSVNSLAWNPHTPGMLASASDDGTALVWDLKTKTVIHSCITPELEALSTVVWSPLDPDFIITGCRDTTINIWKLSENPCRRRPNRRPYIKPINATEEVKEPMIRLPPAPQLETNMQVLERALQPKTETESSPPNKKPARKFLLNGIALAQNSSDSFKLLEGCRRLYMHLYVKRYEDHVQENGKTDEDKSEFDKFEEEVFDILKLFGDKDDFNKLLNSERANHLNQTQHLSLESISLWQGDLKDTIRKAIAGKALNTHLVSAAPMISFDLWKEACETYAKQLSESSIKSTESAYYYLVCHKVEEAIDVLCKGHFYREALAVAKCRLQSSDPKISTILNKWADFCEYNGNYETAAQCFIVLGELEKAAKILFRRNRAPALRLSLTLARRIDNKSLVDSIKFNLGRLCSAKVESEKEKLKDLLTRKQLELKNNQEKEHCKSEDESSDSASNAIVATEVPPQITPTSTIDIPVANGPEVIE